ncbi:hypothetical protein OLMES_3313 [Oleiphilus messinensis]|uniref:Uncharacterized protein n=1 Tax=Oleiphilus messinensis TaxID=141451 RepID=A0A1Y0ID95_9GAMM|nr:hypothetical protein [Oleiphilus messinensis]ARU57353.1 hypothetical protein OLMES_3313 [Oleiphilus messinensis]
MYLGYMRHSFWGKFVLSLSLLVSSVAFAAEEVSDQLKKEEETNTKYLLGQVLNKAKSLQETYGDFAPFGAGLFPNGEFKFVWLAKPGETVSDPIKAMELIRTTLKAQAERGRLLGSAITYKFKAAEDAPLQFNTEVEYLSGYSKLVAVQIAQGEDKKVEFGAVKDVEFEGFIFNKLKEEQEAKAEEEKK